MKNRRFTKISLGGLLCLPVLFAGCCINLGCMMLGRYERTVELSAPLSPGSTFDAQTHNGAITINGADVTECRVTATIVTRAANDEEAQELAEQVEIELETVGETLTVKADKPKTGHNRSISISYTITVPKRTHLECSSSYGSIKVTDIYGNVNTKTSSGSITVENIEGSANLDTSNGSVVCEELTGDSIKLHSGSGSIKVTQAVADTVDLSISYGSVKTERPITISGEVSKKKIRETIGQGTGKLHLHTGSGSISLMM